MAVVIMKKLIAMLSLVLFLLGALRTSLCAPVLNEIPCQETVWPHSQLSTTEYTYSASVSHFLSGSVPRSTTHLSCEVTLRTTSDCRHLLQVQNCATKHDGMNTKQIVDNVNDVSSHGIMFELDEDHTIQEIKADVNDTTTSVNIKRGVLSLLQHSLHRNVEDTISQRSVHGTCTTQYNKESDSDIVMTTDLNTCAHSSIHKLLPLVQLPDRTRIQEAMPVNSKKDCSIHLNQRQRLDDISCKETHLDTVGHEQVKHRVVLLQQLKLQRVRQTSPPPTTSTGSVYTRIDIRQELVDHSASQNSSPVKNPTTGDLKRSLTELHQIFETKGSRPLESFKELTSKAKFSSKQSLSHVLNSIVKCTLSGCTHNTKSSLLNLWFDVLVSCSTVPCLESAVYLVTSVPMSHSHRRLLWYGLTLTTDLNEDMTISLINKCSQHPRDDCIISLSIILNQEDVDLTVVVKYVTLLKEQLQTACSSTKKLTRSSRSRDSVKLVLKAVSNLGEKVLLYDRMHQSFDSILTLLHKCLQTSENTDILQMIFKSIQMPHYWSQSKSLIVETFQDTVKTLEVRVAALKAMLQSEDITMAAIIIDTHERETNKQFKAYLTSYLSSVLQENTNITDSVQNTLKMEMTSQNLSMPIMYSESQTSKYGVLRSSLPGGESSTIEVHTLYYPGSLVPNALNLQLNIQAYGLKYNLADFGLHNEGFDFTSDFAGEDDDQTEKYRHLSAILSQALQNLQHQVTKTFTLPFIEADYGLIGQLLGSTKFQDFSLWSAFAHSHDFHSIWSMLNLDYIMSKLQNGLYLNWNKYSQMPLLEVSLPTGMGVPLKYSLNGAMAFYAKSEVVINSEAPIESFLDLVEKTLKGNIDFRNILEVSSAMSVCSDEASSSEVDQMWDQGIHQPFSASSTDNEISLSVPVLLPQQHSSQYKISAKIIHTNDMVEQIPVELRANCLLSFLEDLIGWQFCKPLKSNELPIVSHLKSMMSQVSDVVHTMVPTSLKNSLSSFLHKSMDFINGAFVLKIKFPTSSNNSLQPQHWLELLNAAWIRVREAAISVPSTYTATVYDAGTVVTFDGELYQFPGYNNKDCTYVLANDYSGYKFTLLQSRDYMTAVLNEIAVSLYKDGRVMVNNSGSFSDLPLFSWNQHVSVRREGSVVQLSTTYGVGVTCNTEAHYCSYTLNGWYHNKTLGLLGTNDNEASNDFKLKDGSIVRHISTFVNAYEITGDPGCRHRSTRRKPRAVCSSKEKTCMCNNLFHRGDSPLAACFPFINPVQYKNVCMNQGSCTINTNGDSQFVCHIATVYSQMCLQKGIHVHPVPECVLCHPSDIKEHNSTKTVGQTWTEQLEQKVDLVLVTSLHQDMEAEGVPLSTYLNHMVSRIKGSLTTENIHDVQLGLIGYDGADLMDEPHAYTFNGNLFSSVQNLQTVHQKVSLITALGSRSGKHSEALHLAAEYPFRTEAVKLVMWLSPSQQQKGDLSSVLEEFEKINLNLNVVDIDIDQHSEIQERENSIFTRQLALKMEATLHRYRHSINRVTDKITDNVKNYTQQCQTCQCRVNNIALGQIYCQQSRCL